MTMLPYLVALRGSLDRGSEGEGFGRLSPSLLPPYMSAYVSNG